MRKQFAQPCKHTFHRDQAWVAARLVRRRLAQTPGPGAVVLTAAVGLAAAEAALLPSRAEAAVVVLAVLAHLLDNHPVSRFGWQNQTPILLVSGLS